MNWTVWPGEWYGLAMPKAGLLCLIGLEIACSGGPAPSMPSPVPPAASPASAQRFVVRISERPSGSLVIERSGNEQRASFEYNDRGRGPKLRTRAIVASDGRMVGLTVDGVDYFKGPVAERFGEKDGIYTWRSGAGNGSQSPIEPAVYVPLHGTPAESALLVNALISAGKPLPVLPAGEVRAEEIARMKVTGGGGRTAEPVLYAVSGLGFLPSYLWLEDGRLFADISDWTDTVREGWEGAVDTLRTRQFDAMRVHLRRAAAVAIQPAGALVIRDVALFDAARGKLLPGRTVIVRGQRIEQVGEARAIAVPAGAQVIDGTGHTLLPGLWDMHVHVGEPDGALHIAAGVTSVRDLANDIDQLAATRKAFDSGELAGPRMVMAGFMDGTSEFTGPTKVVVDTEEQARAAIARYAELGYQQIKVYSSIKPELVPVIARLAHERGLKVSGHVPAFMTAEQAVRQGFDELQHVNFLLLNFLFDKVQDTRTPARFTAIAEHGGDIDLDSPQAKAFIALLRDKRIVVDPTVAIFEDMLVARPGQISPGYAAVADRLPVGLQQALRAGGLTVAEGKDARHRAGFAKMLELIGRLHRAGVPIVAGTDSFAGFTLHRELELYVDAGLRPAEVLTLATLGAARIAGRDRDTGSIEKGKLADLVLVRGNPVDRIGDIRNTALTIKGGVIYPSAALYRELGVKHPVAAPVPARPPGG